MPSSSLQAPCSSLLSHELITKALIPVEGGWRMQEREKSNKEDHVWWVLSHPDKDEVLIIKTGIYMGTRPLAFTPTCTSTRNTTTSFHNQKDIISPHCPCKISFLAIVSMVTYPRTAIHAQNSAKRKSPTSTTLSDSKISNQKQLS